MSARSRIRIALVAEELSARPDEGALRVLDRLASRFAERFEFIAFHARGSSPEAYPARKLEFTRLGVSRALASALREWRPELVLYVPSASLTANALWRARLLGRAAWAPVAVLGLQQRNYGPVGRLVLRFLEPDAVVVTAAATADGFRRRGWKVILFRTGVDPDRFVSVGETVRVGLARELGWPSDRRVVLHVGHLRRNRGLSLLERLARDPQFHVVLIASVSETGEEALAGRVVASGVELHHEYIPDIERFYQAADAYFFPVRHRASAIDFPLSVLEALSCGTPVLTTPYGALPEHFEGTGGLRFLEDGEDPAAAIEDLLSRASRPSELALPFAWDVVIDELVLKLQELVA